jgi:glycosyltransferase involved in cell wall biosynthesis
MFFKLVTLLNNVKMPAKVTIFQRIIPHYRKRFFDKLYLRLRENNIELRVIYGQHRVGSVPEGGRYNEPWAIFTKNIYLSFLGKEFVLQKGFKLAKSTSDLIIVEQANRLILNYIIMLFKNYFEYSIGYWGHGRNYQSTKNGISSRIKSILIGKADWWFAYTQSSANELEKHGFPSEKITIVQNSIDATQLTATFDEARDGHRDYLKAKLNIKSNNIGLFCGGFDKKKEIDFVLAACDSIKLSLTDFHMIFIGHGPAAEKVSSFAATRTWVSYLGKITSDERAQYFHISKCLIMPGALGLVVIDSFALRTPLITSNLATHSPEFDYLENHENSHITSFDINSYTKGVVSTLNNEQYLEKIKLGCDTAAKLYTLPVMVERFANGIEQCLWTQKIKQTT